MCHLAGLGGGLSRPFPPMASPMLRVLLFCTALTCGAASSAGAQPASSHSGLQAPTHGPFLTLLFSRSELSLANRCVPDNVNVVRLDTGVAPELHRRGLKGTGTVQTSVTRMDHRGCVHFKGAITASWPDLERLRDQYRWSFVSHSRTFETNLGEVSARALYRETCGTLRVLRKHGHERADGLFAYPNNKWSVRVQRRVAKCFAFGRRYNREPGLKRTVMRKPFFQNTEGISGGRCHLAGAPCVRLPSITKYRSPVVIADQLARLTRGRWLTLQAYVLVTGSRPGEWDCTSPNWKLHWSIDPERYCWVDYLQILDAIPGYVNVVDPKTVARVWGRKDDDYSPPPPPPPPPN
jgi:hypothetical protein